MAFLFRGFRMLWTAFVTSVFLAPPGAFKRTRREGNEEWGWMQDGEGYLNGKGVGLEVRREVEISIALEEETHGDSTEDLGKLVCCPLSGDEIEAFKSLQTDKRWSFCSFCSVGRRERSLPRLVCERLGIKR